MHQYTAVQIFCTNIRYHFYFGTGSVADSGSSRHFCLLCPLPQMVHVCLKRQSVRKQEPLWSKLKQCPLGVRRFPLAGGLARV